MDLDNSMLFSRYDENGDETQAIDVNTEKYLIYHSDDLLFGVSAEFVEEIITNYSVTPVPLVPYHVVGVINLRGQIIPVVAMRRLIGQNTDKEGTCIIILKVQDTSVGVLVDEVMRMVDIDKTEMQPAPRQSANSYVNGVCHLPDKQTMLIFACERVLD